MEEKEKDTEETTNDWKRSCAWLLHPNIKNQGKGMLVREGTERKEVMPQQIDEENLKENSWYTFNAYELPLL